MTGMTLTWQSVSIVVSAKKLALLMLLWRVPILSSAQKPMRYCLCTCFSESPDCSLFASEIWIMLGITIVCDLFGSYPCQPQFLSIMKTGLCSAWSGITVWQREVVGEWWSLGDRDSRELAIREHISLNMHFHLCGLEINTNQQCTICLLVGMDICCMDRLLWPE